MDKEQQLEKDQSIKIRELFQEIKSLKPSRQGVFLGEENEKFYIAKTEEEVYELSALAYYVWLLCDGEHTVEEMILKMSQDIQVSEEEVIEPLVIALDNLSHAGLIKFI